MFYHKICRQIIHPHTLHTHFQYSQDTVFLHLSYFNLQGFLLGAIWVLFGIGGIIILSKQKYSREYIR